MMEKKLIFYRSYCLKSVVVVVGAAAAVGIVSFVLQVLQSAA
jgi:hypothetical protein